jgi:Flp pilus assembly protein TadG
MEFVLGLMVVFSFFFFFIRMSALFAIANYIHYATFMAARAYSSGSDTVDAREERAKEVVRAILAARQGGEETERAERMGG